MVVEPVLPVKVLGPCISDEDPAHGLLSPNHGVDSNDTAQNKKWL